MPEWIGKTLGKVRIDSLLAHGGMAEVYLGTHLTLQRPVAVKLLLNRYQDDPEMLDRFQREAHVVAILRHPNIVQVFDYDVFDGQPFLVMEYVAGVSLSTYLRALHENSQQLELSVIGRMLTALAEALQYARQQGVIHRDVKPANILLTSSSSLITPDKPLPADVQPVLSDFGLVRFLNSNVQTASGFIAGTPAYMSPEQARGDKVDGRSDIYSLGVVLYEMLAGRVPFEADSTMGLLMKHINEPPAPIPGISPAIQAVLMHALEKKPDERYQSSVQMAADFMAAIGQEAGATTKSESTTYTAATDTAPTIRRLARPRSRAGWIWAAVGTCLFLLAAAVLLVPRSLIGLGPFSTTGIPPTDVMTGMNVSAMNNPNTYGLLRFDDLAGYLDQVILTAKGMKAPPAGFQYEVWLTGDETRRSLGILKLDKQGNGQVGFIDSQGRDLIAQYDRMEITVEPDPDANPNPSGQVEFSSGIPPKALVHIRHLFVSFSQTPDQIGLLIGLTKDAQLLDDQAKVMLAANQSGNTTAVRASAEAMYNILVGKQSKDYGDLDGNGKINDPSDGYGLLLNGDSLGYIGGTIDHAQYAMQSGDASANILMHGEHVVICAQNMEGWATQLRDLLSQVNKNPFGPQANSQVRQAVALADSMLNGRDLNGNEQVEPVPGEGGAKTALEHASYMIDMPIIAGPNMLPPAAPAISGPTLPAMTMPPDYYSVP